ncbi:MAG: aminotransferase class I/II-fold pyridoxal phosphate-dependent enzyme [Bacteroidales bacterium]|nr:aminotransferase class I/II-fold pyridoxal phosphate-dependent enzyme [Bacteroidales bacterium]
MKSKLHQAYNPESFRKLGHEIIDLLSTHLHDASNGRKKVINWKEPAAQLGFWQQNMTQEQSLTDMFKDVIDNSISIHHPQYIGHQVGATMPVAALADLLGALLNNGMAVYEMGAAGTAIEKVVIDLINKQLGYGPDADGFMTSGGTLANLTALLAARKAMAGTDIWQEGHNEKLAVMVSAEAHYCIDRSLRIMGFGSEGIIKIPVNKHFSLDATLLEEYLEKAESKGIKVIAVVGSAPSTATGMYDDLQANGKFCQKHGLWFHIDGAHGGAAIFSEKYKQLVSGIEMADSVVIDAHKMMMAPVLTTFLLFKNKKHSHANFSQKALYLWEKQDEEEWYNYARRTFECTKLMMSLKFYAIIKSYGTDIFDEFVTRQYDLGKVLAQSIQKRPDFELFIEPDSNIVCFRFVNPELDESSLNRLNASIRRSLLEQGDFYIVQTQLNHKTWFRVTIMSPFTTAETFEELLNRIELLANKELKTFIS